MKLDVGAGILERLFQTEEDGELADRFWNEVFFRWDEAQCAKTKVLLSSGKRPFEAYRQVFLSQANAEEKEAYAEIAFGYGMEELRPLDPKTYEANPYHDLLKGAAFHRGDLALKTSRIKAYVPFLCDAKKADRKTFYADVSPVGFFPRDYLFPCLNKKGRTWMSLVPHEIETMKKPIAEAKGRVATLGGGLGYYAFMASQKEEVSSVTIYEKDPLVCEVLKNVLLPRFPHKEKIRLVEADAMTYVNESYDYVFADLWHDAEDGLPLYIALKKIEKNDSIVSYWIEHDILVYFRRYVISYLQEVADGVGEEAYEDVSSFPSRLFRALHLACQKKAIHGEEELLDFLGEENLSSLAKELVL